MVNLINSCGWQKVARKPHLAYPLLVKVFISNFNPAIEKPGAEHRYTIWVCGKWIKFNPAVIENYYGLTDNDIEHILADNDMTLVTQFLHGRADAWPIVGAKFLHNQLTESLGVFHIFLAMLCTIDYMHIEMDSLNMSNTVLRRKQRTINCTYDDHDRRMLYFVRCIDDIYTIVSLSSALSIPYHESTSAGLPDQPKPCSSHLPSESN
ncbi:hypothetical protein Adt_23497 [Abeliophyllum distichum]|uniref:Uncharacterized protein n=1 Tax=Abeliophyllum distichum TaxID=126358 RepID=A0ABD1SE16_9LAMI